MSYEVEKMFLLDGQEGYEQLMIEMGAQFPEAQLLGESAVRSFFYEQPTREQVGEVVRTIYQSDQHSQAVASLLESSGEFMIKLRTIDEQPMLAVKGSRAGSDPIHASQRQEFEEPIPMSLDDADSVFEAAGLTLASRWLSQRTFYDLAPNLKMNVEFVDGYGYKVEIEMLTDDSDEVEELDDAIEEIAANFGLDEADPALMKRMYEYCQTHWSEYYGTGTEFSDEVWEQLGRKR